MRPLRPLAALLAAALVSGACGVGSDDDPSGASQDVASIVVTTNILGDVVSRIVGDEADVTTIIPVGANPHDFQASAQQAAAMRKADLLVVNGGGFEEGLEDVIHGAAEDGVPLIEAVVTVESRGTDESTAHAHHGADPHFFTDPLQMADAVRAIGDAIVEEVEGVDAGTIESAVDNYLRELDGLHADIEATLAPIPDDQRVLVTTHEVFGYFADRYGFEVVGTVIPGGSTSEGASAGHLANLADVMRAHGVTAVFTDTSAPDRLAEALASELEGDVQVVGLYTESLGEPGSDGASYLDMMRTNASRIAAALD